MLYIGYNMKFSFKVSRIDLNNFIYLFNFYKKKRKEKILNFLFLFSYQVNLYTDKVFSCC